MDEERRGRLEKTTAAADRLAKGRVSMVLFVGILGLPLGCAFVVGFLVVVLVVGGFLALVGLDHWPVANWVALIAALVGGFALAVVVYRKLIPRLPWLQRLINRS